MITKQKNVYYCEFCKKYRLTKPSMEKHEKHCTLNPDRECRVCGEYDKEGIGICVAYLKKEYSETIDKNLRTEEVFGLKTIKIDEVHIEKFKKVIEETISEIDCPACVLSCLRQAGNSEWFWGIGYYYDYRKEAKDYWEAKRAEEYYE